ncbi:hypothetical protein MKW94_027796 [Papaver nudicaule]|uniref:RNB domain-containing protein n=1 Tax=Papaver nudicaule TaxID=74823 RepID=A0AA41SI59_PAPNU|nr:hypothetical protein [Papaver nudicaule]
MYQIREANQMVEEFMLAANISVAEKILKHFPVFSLLRHHLSPTKEMLEPLLRTLGLGLDVSSSKALADSLDQAVAVYLCSGDLTPPEFLHYGLAAALYTHFTSPIRRYAGQHETTYIWKLQQTHSYMETDICSELSSMCMCLVVHLSSPCGYA